MSGYRSKKMLTQREENAIQIDGLTNRQYYLLEKMWSLDTEENLREWQESLEIEDQFVVESLVTVVLLEHLDRILNMDEECLEAKKVISKFTLH